MVVVAPTAQGVRVPDDVAIANPSTARRVHIHEEVAGRRWRISGRSFFQTRPDGADALVKVVGESIEHHAGSVGRRLVDLCAGVGLFAGSIPARNIVAIESSRSACADARHNLADIAGDVSILPIRVEQWRPSEADVVIADPSREGLGRHGVDKIAATRAATVVLVSCDAGSLGRDAGLLAAAGYSFRAATVVDLFPQTHHVEVVSTFVR